MICCGTSPCLCGKESGHLQPDLSPNGPPGSPRTPHFVAAFSGLIAPLSFLLILVIYLSLTVQHFATLDNFKEIVIQASVVSILACGQTAVIISGNIDLSV